MRQEISQSYQGVSDQVFDVYIQDLYRAHHNSRQHDYNCSYIFEDIITGRICFLFIVMIITETSSDGSSSEMTRTIPGAMRSPVGNFLTTPHH